MKLDSLEMTLIVRINRNSDFRQIALKISSSYLLLQNIVHNIPFEKYFATEFENEENPDPIYL